MVGIGDPAMDLKGEADVAGVLKPLAAHRMNEQIHGAGAFKASAAFKPRARQLQRMVRRQAEQRMFGTDADVTAPYAEAVASHRAAQVIGLKVEAVGFGLPRTLVIVVGHPAHSPRRRVSAAPSLPACPATASWSADRPDRRSHCPCCRRAR